MTSSPKLTLAIFVLTLGLAFPAGAQAPPPAPTPTFTIATCTDQAGNEADAQRNVDAAMASFQAGGFAALERHLPALRRVAEAAPACHPQIERRDGEILVRTSDAQKYSIISAAIASAAHELGQRTTIRMASNPFVDADMVLGAYEVEAGRYQEALAWLDRGLALQPHNDSLIMEKATALNGLQRFAEAQALLQAALEDRDAALTLDRARFLRVSGITLIDLNRLDEAEAALTESIRLQPNNPIARQELDYIAQLRAGGERRGLTIIAPNAPTPDTL